MSDPKVLYEENKSSINVLDINWRELRNNLQYFRKKIGNSKLMLMVKTAAYGTSSVGISQQVEKEQLADYLAVAFLSEGIELREAGIELPIVILNPQPEDWEQMIYHCLEPEIYNLELLKSFSDFVHSSLSIKEGNYPIHLEFNTGMNRMGMEKKDLDPLIAMLSKEQAWEVKSVMTHLSSTSLKEEDEFSAHQVQQFQLILEKFKPYLPKEVIIHSLNSHGIERLEDFHFDMVRLGIGMHGASSLPQLQKKLHPTIQFKSKIIDFRKVEKGTSIGYDRAEYTTSACTIATIPLGYADGLSRKLGNGAWKVEINGKLYPIIGNICMDLCMINVGDDPIQLGDEVIIFGGEKSIFDYANALELITYEAMTSLGPRVKRRLIEEFQ